MRKVILPLLLVALVLPLAAAAEEGDPGNARAAATQTLEGEGPLLIKGKGRLRGELQIANPAETRAVVFRGRLGGIRLVDLGGDLRVKCQGRGSSGVREDDEGHKVYVCKGRGGRVHAHGSHFEVQLAARRYGAMLPAGVTGTLTGVFRTCVPGESCGQGDRKRGEPKQKPADDKAPSDEEIDGLIDELAGGDE